jgi:peptidoglycan/LPS O-acetylase OafA/YrhL
MAALLFACLLWCALAMALSGVVTKDILADLLRSFAYAPAAAPALILLCLNECVLARFICSRPVRFMGEISYSVYVFQFLILVTLKNSGWTAMTGNSEFNAIMLMVASIVVVTGLGAASYWLFEKPARRLLRAGLLRPLQERALQRVS